MDGGLFTAAQLSGVVPPVPEEIGPGAWVLRGFACAAESELLVGLDEVVAEAPWRHMRTPAGHRMSVAMTNCGVLGWVSDGAGYRYVAEDPETKRPWPSMPRSFCELAISAAVRCGYADFAPDACLVNRYEPGARMSMHQDRDERDFSAPIVSASLGLPSVFLFGGETRAHKALRVPLRHGDVVVWGGASRLFFHGILPVKNAALPELGAVSRCRVNLTFRRAR